MNANWLKYFPEFIRDKLNGRHSLQIAFSNTGWLFADRIMRMGVGIVVVAWFARYLGPQQFGLWNYTVAFAALFSAFANLGLDGIVVRELSKSPEQKNILLGSAFALKLVGSTTALFLAIFSIAVVRHEETLTIWLVSLSAAGYIFQSANVIDLYFQSKIKSKYSVIAATTTFILITLVKIILLLKSAPLIFFACAGLIEIIFGAFLLLFAYRLDHNNIRSWKYDSQIAKNLVRDSWPLVFLSFAILIQAKIDQVMLANIISDEEVGQYSAAMKLVEFFGFIPMIIMSTLAPYVTRAKMKSEALYHERLVNIYRLMFILFLLIAVPIFFLGGEIVLFIFGNEYKRAAFLLSLMSIRLFFTNFGVAKSLFITNENLFKYSLVTAVIGAVFNIAGNYFLIPKYQSEGAIIATIISFSITTFGIDIFYSSTRVNLKLMLHAICTPLRFSQQQ